MKHPSRIITRTAPSRDAPAPEPSQHFEQTGPGFDLDPADLAACQRLSLLQTELLNRHLEDLRTLSIDLTERGDARLAAEGTTLLSSAFVTSPSGPHAARLRLGRRLLVREGTSRLRAAHELHPERVDAHSFARLLLASIEHPDDEQALPVGLAECLRFLLACQLETGAFAAWPSSFASASIAATADVCRALGAALPLLHPANRPRVKQALRDARIWLEGEQQPDGTWQRCAGSAWAPPAEFRLNATALALQALRRCRGAGTGTVARTLGTRSPSSEAEQRALRWLRARLVLATTPAREAGDAPGLRVLGHALHAMALCRWPAPHQDLSPLSMVELTALVEPQVEAASAIEEEEWQVRSALLEGLALSLNATQRAPRAKPGTASVARDANHGGLMALSGSAAPDAGAPLLPMDMPSFSRIMRTFGRPPHTSNLRRTLTGAALITTLGMVATSVRAARRRERTLGVEHGDQPLGRPLYIVAAPRSGTTLLHRLLELDPRFTTMKLYQSCFAALPFYRSARRLAELDDQLGGRLTRMREWMDEGMFGGWRDVHPTGLDQAEEDEPFFMFAAASPGFFLFTPFFEGSEEIAWINRFPEERRRPLIQGYRDFLQRHLYVHPGKTLLAKNVMLAGRMGIVREAVPSARFVHLVRHPYEVIPSALSMLTAPWKFHSPDIPTDGPQMRRLADITMAYYKELAQQCDASDPDHFLELRYTDLVEDPDQAVQRIYTHFDLDWNVPLARRIRAATRKQAGHRSKHQYSLAQFGLSREQVHAAMPEIFERYGFRP